MLSKSLKFAKDGSVVVTDSKLARLFQSFTDESDRGLVVIVGTILEEKLGRILKEILIQKKESDALVDRNLSGFEARAKAAYCIGAISRCEYGMIEAIRRIRNDFAHQFVTDDFDGRLESKKAQVMDALAKFLPGYDRESFPSVRKAFEAFAVSIVTELWDREHELDKSDYIHERE